MHRMHDDTTGSCPVPFKPRPRVNVRDLMRTHFSPEMLLPGMARKEWSQTVLTSLLLMSLVILACVGYNLPWMPSNPRLLHSITPAESVTFWAAAFSLVPILLSVCMWLSVCRVQEIPSAGKADPQLFRISRLSASEILPWAVVGVRLRHLRCAPAVLTRYFAHGRLSARHSSLASYTPFGMGRCFCYEATTCYLQQAFT